MLPTTMNSSHLLNANKSINKHTHIIADIIEFQIFQYCCCDMTYLYVFIDMKIFYEWRNYVSNEFNLNKIFA